MLKGLIKEILKEELTGKEQSANIEKSLSSHLEGKVCMFRTYAAGVHFGELVKKNGQECHVKNARRVWSWAKACSLSQLAMEGDKDISNCKIAMAVNEIILDQVIEVIPMEKEAVDIMYEALEWKK